MPVCRSRFIIQKWNMIILLKACKMKQYFKKFLNFDNFLNLKFFFVNFPVIDQCFLNFWDAQTNILLQKNWTKTGDIEQKNRKSSLPFELQWLLCEVFCILHDK